MTGTPSFLLPSNRTIEVHDHTFEIRELTAADMAGVSAVDPSERGFAIVSAAVSLESGESMGDPRTWAAKFFQPLLRHALEANGMTGGSEEDGDEEATPGNVQALAASAGG